MHKRNLTYSTPSLHQAEELKAASPTIQENPTEEDEKLTTHKSFTSFNSIHEDKKGTLNGLNTSEDTGMDMMTILNKTTRTDKEAWYLYNQIKDFRFFTQFIENIDEHERVQAVTYICKKLEYVTYEMGDVIMKQGSFSDGKVCITLSGELLVMVNSFPSSADPESPKANADEKEEEEKKEEPKEEKREPSPMEELGRFSAGKSPTLIIQEGAHQMMRQESGQYNIPRRSTSLTKIRSETRQSTSKTFGLLSPQAVPVEEIEESKPIPSKTTLGTVPSLQKLPTRQTTMVIPAARPSIDFDNLATLNILKKEKSDQKTVAPVQPQQQQQDQESEDPFAGQDMLQRNYGLVVNKLYCGSYFGERALFKKHRRTATIIANSKAEILKLGVEDFQYVLSEFNKTKKLMMRFLRDIFPNLDEVQTPILLENLSYTYNIKNCAYHNLIMSEGKRGDEFYVIYEGKCELIKTMIYDRSDNLSPNMMETKALYRMRKTTKEEILVMTLERGMIFGEEIIFNVDPVYEYTVRVSSEKAKLMSFKKQKFLYKCPKIVLQGLNDVYTNKKERINKIVIDRLEKKGTKASAGMLEDGKPVIAFPKTMTTYGPDLHKKRGHTLQSLATSNLQNQDSKAINITSFPNLPKSLAAFEENIRGSPSRLIKPLQLDPPKSPKSGRFDGIFSVRENDIRKTVRNNSQGPRVLIQPKTGSPEPGLPRSTGTSPQRGVHSPYHKMVGMGGVIAEQIERLKTRNEMEGKDIGSHNNLEGIFKVDFGKVDKNMDKKYKAYKVKQGLIKTTTNLVDLSKGSSLADFLTHRLREKNYIKESQIINSLNASPRARNQHEGAPSYNSIFMDSSPNEPQSAKRVDSQSLSRRVDVRKLTFMQDLSVGGSREQLSPVFQHIPAKKQAPQLTIKPLFNKKELVMDDLQMKKPITPRKLGKSLSTLSASVVKMEVNYSSGLAMKTPKEGK